MSFVLRAEGISKSYHTSEGENLVLRDLTFHANENEFVSFVGPSGCGKSTLFNIITGLLEPDSGSISVRGVDTTGQTNRDVGYVLQKDLLFPWRTVMENVVLGLEIQGVKRSKAREKARGLFETYHLDGYEDRYPARLSGGMRQRAALMRTMVTDPSIILMDEAYKALDYPLKLALESELLEQVRQQRKTAIFVTHDIEEAVTLSDRVYVMKARPGEIIHEFEIDLGTDSHLVTERRTSPRFNEYYELIWRSIGTPTPERSSR